jgi:hypothetical protein
MPFLPLSAANDRSGGWPGHGERAKMKRRAENHVDGGRAAIFSSPRILLGANGGQSDSGVAAYSKLIQSSRWRHRRILSPGIHSHSSGACLRVCARHTLATGSVSKLNFR